MANNGQGTVKFFKMHLIRSLNMLCLGQEERALKLTFFDLRSQHVSLHGLGQIWRELTKNSKVV